MGGAWLTVRCLGEILGKYPNEFTLTKDIAYGRLTEVEMRFTQVPVEFYIYMGLVLLISLAGIFYQFKIYKEMKENDELDKDDEDEYKKA